MNVAFFTAGTESGPEKKREIGTESYSDCLIVTPS
jgi:hypothetical protein